MMEKNTIHHADWMTNDLPDGSVNLIIADPPYFEIKGDFDFVWDSFDDYLKDVEKWAVECKRLLAENGTLFWYGDDKRIAYAQIIFDKYFNLVNHLGLVDLAIGLTANTVKLSLLTCVLPASCMGTPHNRFMLVLG